MNKPFAENPSLEHLKSQARDLLREMRLSDPSARLHQAQRRIAQEHGLVSWPQLVEHVETILMARKSFAQAIEIVERGILQGRQAKAANMALAIHPRMAFASPACALVALDAAAVDQTLTDPVVPIGRFKLPPIVYAAFSPAAGAKPQELCGILTKLLDAGADVNSSMIHPDYPDSPLSILYGVSGVARSPAATRLLLERGANPNDNESLYHSTESRDHSCLLLLLEHGAKTEGTNALLRMLDHEDLEGLETLLPYCNLAEPNALLHAVRRGRGDAILARLLEAGADPHLADEHGVTAARLAFERGRNVAGLTDGLAVSDEDRLLAACWRGDTAEAARLRHAAANLSNLRRHAFADACWEGRADSVDAFIAGGFSLTDRQDSGGTPLHAAAFAGSTETIRKLLPHGPPLDDTKDMYEAIPLQWAMHASEWMAHAFRNPDYPGSVELLIQAGSPPPVSVFGSDAVREVVRDAFPDLAEG